MSEMVEQVAKAIWELWSNIDGVYDQPAWADLKEKDKCLDLARAAIEAMREPTKAMRLLGNDREIWRAMIDAALRDP